MTAQVSDTFAYKGDTYFLIGIIGDNLTSPELFGMKPVMINTACYRGYYAAYEITDKALYLRELTLRTKDGDYLPIEGKEPLIEEYQATYHGLSVEISFTGKVRIAGNFIQELYIHMGYQTAIAFKTVLDITLKDGRVIEIKDRSRQMEQKRQIFKKHHRFNNFKEIEKAFSMDMDLE